MSKTRPHPSDIERVFTALVQCAITGERCTQNDGLGNRGADCIRALASSGRIRIEISGRNYRKVTILTGPHAGKSTAADPTGMRVWRVLDKTGSRVNGEPYQHGNARLRRLERLQRGSRVAA